MRGNIGAVLKFYGSSKLMLSHQDHIVNHVTVIRNARKLIHYYVVRHRLERVNCRALLLQSISRNMVQK